MINVNYHTQGDAHLLIDGSVNVMIDVGEKYAADAAVVPYLKSKGIKTIHHLFVSHPHTDHYGGIDSLIDAGIRIENVYYNLPPDGMQDWNYKRHEFLETINRSERSGSNPTNVRAGFRLTLPSSKIKVLYAHKGTTLSNGRKVSINDYSLMIQWDLEEYRALFTGDLNEPLGTELAMKAHYKADILKVPHHGATGVAPDAFFDTVNPSLNMFPSTKVLWYHPRVARVKAWTTNSDIYYCNNGLNGNVVLTIDQDSIYGMTDQPTDKCPNAKLDIRPGKKIDAVLKGTLAMPAISNLILDE